MSDEFLLSAPGRDGVGGRRGRDSQPAGFCISKRIYKVNLPQWLEAKKEGEV